MSGSPALLAKLPQAGHTQFLDKRSELALDPCNVGKDRDKFVGQLCCQLVALWAQACVPACSSQGRLAPSPGPEPPLEDERQSGGVDTREFVGHASRVAQAVGITVEWMVG